MPIVVDGNNLLHRLRTGERSREQVRRLTLDLARGQRIRVVVVFDGPPPAGTPAREELGQVSVRYSGARPADDVIIDTLPGGGAASNWVVVSDDRELRRRARDRGASVRSLAEWQGQRPRRSRPARPRAEARLSSREVEEWQEFFANRPEED